MLSCLTVLVPLAMSSFPGDGGTLKYIESGASDKIGYYAPIRLELTDTAPDSLKKAPAGLAAPLYGIITPAGVKGRAYHVILDEPEGKPATLFLDSNGNGDFTDDGAAEWSGKARPGPDGKEYTMYSGGGTIEFVADGKPLKGHLLAYRFDKTDPKREAMKKTLLYYRDYAAAGELSLGGKNYNVIIEDAAVTGDFTGASKPSAPAVDQAKADPARRERGPIRLLIDVNGNGKFDSRGESFDAKEPFNIAGTTWELASISPDGTAVVAKVSDKTVAEIPTPPQHEVGKPILAFQAKDMDGKDINFPGGYAGKIVLLDFWATWCGPCMGEMPNVVAAYEKFHDKGFEILGVSLDNKDAAEKIKKTASDKKMTWPQIYDGGGWKAEVANKYAISSIPAAFLVDGDTGLIIGAGESLRGEGLAKAIEAALAKKKG